MAHSINDSLDFSVEAKLLLLRLAEGLSFSVEPRSVLTHSYFALALEHQEAIIVLVRLGLVGSAFALLRPQFEAVYRALWVHGVATDEQALNIKANNLKTFPRRFQTLAAELDKRYPGASFAGMVASHWNYLCDLTHNGVEQLIPQIQSDGKVLPNYSIRRIDWVVKSSASISLSMARVFYLDSAYVAKVNAIDAWLTQYNLFFAGIGIKP